MPKQDHIKTVLQKKITRLQAKVGPLNHDLDIAQKQLALMEEYEPSMLEKDGKNV